MEEIENFERTRVNLLSYIERKHPDRDFTSRDRKLNHRESPISLRLMHERATNLRPHSYESKALPLNYRDQYIIIYSLWESTIVDIYHTHPPDTKYHTIMGPAAGR